MGKKEAFVFLKDPENAWIPAKLLTSSGDTADVQIPEYADEQSTICDGGKSAKKWIEAEVDLSDYAKGVLPMQNVDEHGNMRCFSDMVELPFLHEVRSEQHITSMDQTGLLRAFLPKTFTFFVLGCNSV